MQNKSTLLAVRIIAENERMRKNEKRFLFKFKSSCAFSCNYTFLLLYFVLFNFESNTRRLRDYLFRDFQGSFSSKVTHETCRGYFGWITDLNFPKSDYFCDYLFDNRFEACQPKSLKIILNGRKFLTLVILARHSRPKSTNWEYFIIQNKSL